MTLSITAPGVQIRPTIGASARRLAIVCAVASAAVLGFGVTDPAESARVMAGLGLELAHLLRFMAGVKAAMALTIVAAILWRIALPTSFSRFTLYTAAASAMAAGPGLMWGFAHMVLGAVLLHAGLTSSLLLLWRDPAVVSRLGQLVAIRRRDLGPR